MGNTTAEEPRTFSFFKGADDVLVLKDGSQFDWTTAAQKVRDSLSDALNAQNLAFLFGSGTSSMEKDGVQLGVKTMGPLADEFLAGIGGADVQLYLTKEEEAALDKMLGVKVSGDAYSKNLERLMEALLSFEFAISHSSEKALTDASKVVKSSISKLLKFVRARCTSGPFSTGDDTVLHVYQSFLRKLVYRERTRSRPWLFTTNYDLFLETGLDRLGIPYANGFIGSVERRFNPATFRYSLAEQLDISSQKWSAVDSFVYLCKLHGSVNWIEDGEGFFRIREVSMAESQDAERVMIYPTPAKQNASFGSPYSDMFREFQARISQEQSVLFVLGYSFGDEHVNNIIYQALTIPSFRLVILAAPDAKGVAQLRALGDPRIWIIGGDGPSPGERAHYFQTFVTHFMPHLPGNKVDTAVKNVFESLLKRASKGEGE